MARKALGRGIGALLGEETAAAPAQTDNSEIDIDLVKPNAKQPRTNFPEAELEELTQSIRMNGVVQPILVRSVGKGFELVAGERRWRAAQRVGLKKIPAVIREIDDEKMLEIALIENIQRQELNPVEESRAYQQLIDDLGLTQQEVAERVGKTRTFVANYLRLLSLPKSIRTHLEDGKLSVGHAKALLSIPDKKRQKELANAILVKGLSVRDAERKAKKPSKRKSGANAKAPKDPNIKKAETKLRRRYATHVEITPGKSGKSGKIEFEYYGSEDLDRVYNLLMNK
ncbi:MAG: ParB/RepB/Spo0J family partition protein [Pyrinomonadaceae bacterium]|nr:ParB/RepB/Spo0J family partition protein [Pyrinomonadaceae bacterium]